MIEENQIHAFEVKLDLKKVEKVSKNKVVVLNRHSNKVSHCGIDSSARTKEVSKYLVEKRIKNLIQLWSFSGAPEKKYLQN